MERINLFIVDDHTLFREGVKALLSTTEDIVVIGEAGDGQAAMEQVSTLHPDIVLMDIQMPGLSGIQATRQILAQNSTVGIIMVTMLEDDASLFAAMRAGARGYVLKGARAEEMLNVIRVVADGQALFGPAIASRMVRFFQEMGDGQTESKEGQRTEGEPFKALTDREGEVLHLIADGYNNNEIARKLVISPKTVRNHITSIFSKLQVADRSQAIRLARQSEKS